MKNWKTTSTGLLMIVGALTSLFFTTKNNALNEGSIMAAATGLMGGIGLLAAKDYNVTGGTTVNDPNSATAVKEAATENKPQ
jgi:hypothetical protein